MKYFSCIVLIFGVIVNIASSYRYSPFRYRNPYPSNFKNYSNSDLSDLDTLIQELNSVNVSNETPNFSQRKGPYGGEYVSPSSPFELVYEWKIFDFEYPNSEERRAAIISGEFIQENIVPLGIDTYKDRAFLSIPRWKIGNPASLVWLDLPSKDKSPVLRPYPNWSYHSTPTNPDCTKLMAVYRIYIDDCGRLWALDAGLVNTTTNQNYLCPPKIVVFDLITDKLLLTFTIPKNQVKEDSLYVSITVDVRDGRCEEAHAYVAEAWRSGLLVFSWAKKRSWRTTHHFMMPNPHACEHNFLDRIYYQWPDGIFSAAVGLADSGGDRLLYFHPMSSFAEFSVPTSVLQNETIWTQRIDVNEQFKLVGERGVNSHSSTSGIDRDGVLFYTLVDQNAIGCWDTKKVLELENISHVDKNRDIFTFPMDLKVDKATDQSIWVLSTNLPIFLYSSLDFRQVNVRVLRASAKDAVKNSVCDPVGLKTLS